MHRECRGESAQAADVERSCDAAWFHLLEAGLVSSHPDDLVTATLRKILRDARERDFLLQPDRWRVA